MKNVWYFIALIVIINYVTVLVFVCRVAHLILLFSVVIKLKYFYFATLLSAVHLETFTTQWNNKSRTLVHKQSQLSTNNSKINVIQSFKAKVLSTI